MAENKGPVNQLMYYVDLNCDMGEGMNTDAALMPLISSANIACGYHAGDAATIERTVTLALQHGVAIGAHPGFNDRENFGRTEQHLPDNALYDLVAEQLHIMQTVCNTLGTVMTHVKPHGALYNMAAKTPGMARIIAKAVKDAGAALRLYGLSNSWLIKAAQEAGLHTLNEVFADRTYQDDGSLTPRSQPNAMVATETQALEQVLQMVTQQQVTSINGLSIPINAQTICLHGDGPHAVPFAQALNKALNTHHITIRER
jgi:5-oxoprolinase (ATP-hydrolysing) subunit A